MFSWGKMRHSSLIFEFNSMVINQLARLKAWLRFVSPAPLPVALLCLTFAGTASAQQLFQPPGANVTFGDVTHGIFAQSASTNPAAAAAYLAREGEGAKSGTAVSTAVGIEYGNIQEIWDYYDELSKAFSKSDPGDDIGGPGQDPGDKPDGGIDLGQIWDMLDPEIQAKVDSIANQVATQVAALALISAEGYGKAWIAADAPMVFKSERLGGAWTLQLHWSGTSRAFGLADSIEFSREEARAAIEDWFNTEVANRPMTLPIGSQVRLVVDALGNVSFSLKNDSLLASKSSQLAALSVGYGREVWSGGGGTLFAGVKGNLYDMRLSRYGVRFGDITDSEELFDEIRNADFERDTRLGFDLGVLWVGENYQLGAQLKSINEPDFDFPVISLPISNPELIQRLENEAIYTMERQLKLEASLHSKNRRWSFHLGADANSAKDPVGDEFQWLTASVGYSMENQWFPSIRFGYRENLAGTERTYASVGATLFKYVNFDIASALDTTKIDGQALPNSLIASIGFQVSW